MALCLTSNRYRKHIPLLELRCVLQSPGMRSNAGISNRQGGRRLALRASVRPQLALWLGLDLVIIHTYPHMKMGETECSETLAYKIQTPGNYPEYSIKQKKKLPQN
jgi:hypothetical protein